MWCAVGYALLCKNAFVDRDFLACIAHRRIFVFANTALENASKYMSKTVKRMKFRTAQDPGAEKTNGWKRQKSKIHSDLDASKGSNPKILAGCKKTYQQTVEMQPSCYWILQFIPLMWLHHFSKFCKIVSISVRMARLTCAQSAKGNG
jgi:hypothetical protein